MTKTLTELIERAYDIKVYLRLAHYELHQYDDGSFVDFHVQRVTDLPALQRLAGDLEMKFLSGEGYIIVRIFEGDND